MSAEEMHQGPNSSLKPYDAPQLYANDWTPFYQGPISSAQSSQLWDVNGLENGEGVNGQQQHYSHRLQNLHPHSSHVSQYDASIHAMSYSTGRNRAEAHPALPTTHPFPSNQHNTTPGYGELEQYHPSYPYHQPHPSGTPYVLDAKNHSVVPHDSFNNVEQDNPPMPSTQPYHSKISSPLPHTSVRRCFNCQTTDPPSWRRSTLNPSEMLCNRCGLYERTHLRPHPIQFDTPRGGNRSRKHKPETPRTSFKELPGKAGKLPTEMVRHNPVPSNASSHMGNRSEQAHGESYCLVAPKPYSKFYFSRCRPSPHLCRDSPSSPASHQYSLVVPSGVTGRG